jgi:hypothetical protein
MFLCLLAMPVQAAETRRGHPEEAKALALRAAEYVRQHGADSYQKFNDPAGGFQTRDLYVFVIEPSGQEVAGPDTGQNLTEYGFVDDMLHIKRQGWVNYQFRDPITHKPMAKTSYIVRVSDLIVGAGTYSAE